MLESEQDLGEQERLTCTQSETRRYKPRVEKKERKREEDGWKKKVKGNEKERRTEREKELVCVRHT